jgi:hypothetical protein
MAPSNHQDGTSAPAYLTAANIRAVVERVASNQSGAPFAVSTSDTTGASWLLDAVAKICDLKVQAWGGHMKRVYLYVMAAMMLAYSVQTSGAVIYKFKALSGGYNNIGEFQITVPNFIGSNNYGAPVSIFSPSDLDSCSASTLGSVGIPASSLMCADQFFYNNNTHFTMYTANPGTYDVIGFGFKFPNASFGTANVAYYFDKNAFGNPGHYKSLVLGPGQAGTLDVIVSEVPEPSTWSMMIAGVGFAGLFLRRRRLRLLLSGR